MSAWDPSSYPADNLEIGDIPLWFRQLEQALEDVINLEHSDVAGSYGVGDETYTGGIHANGSAVCFIGTSEPTTTPGGVALGTGNVDKARLWLDTNTTPPILRYWSGTAWLGFGLAGEGFIYAGDYSNSAKGDSLPTTQPDGSTTLGAADAGRLAYDTDATYGSCLYRWTGSAWSELGLVNLLNAQTVGGVKTFSSLPMLASDLTPSDDKHLTPKKWVDGVIDAITDPAFGSGDESHTFVGGLIIKVGYVAATGTELTVSFGAAFNAILNVQLTAKHTTNVNINAPIAVNPTTSGFTIYNPGSTSVTGIYWMAIGY